MEGTIKQAFQATKIHHITTENTEEAARQFPSIQVSKRPSKGKKISVFSSLTRTLGYSDAAFRFFCALCGSASLMVNYGKLSSLTVFKKR